MLRKSTFGIESHGLVEDGDISEKTPGALNLPVSKPRVKKRESGSFRVDITISGSSPPCLPDTVTDRIDNELFQHSEQSGLRVPLPRAKKHLSASYLDSMPHIETLFPLENEMTQETPDDISVANKEAEEGLNHWIQFLSLKEALLQPKEKIIFQNWKGRF